MKILLILTLCLISDGAVWNKVTGYSGGGVFIKCKYPTERTQNRKYLCKDSWPFCSDQITTNVENQWVNSGRSSLYDDTKSEEFWVMIRNLGVRDAGLYHCGVDISSTLDIYTPVELSVKTDQFYEKSISKTVHVGGDSTLSCKYPESLRRFPKFLCWKLPGGACSYKHSVKESRKSVKVGKFILNDERAKRIFTVSVRNVSEQDHGEFWCGAEVNWESDHGYKVYFTHISLRVTDPRGSVSTSRPAQPSSSSSSSSSSSPSPSPSASPSSSPSSPPLLLINKLQLTPVPPPAGFPVSAVITVSVILLLLIIGSIFIVVTLKKKQKMQASSARSSGQGPGNHPGVPLDVCVYEDIKDTRRSSASDTETCTIYSNAQLPTILSDQCIYSQAQRPARLSAGSLNYTTVGFHSAAAGDNAVVPRALCNRADVYCEYGTVSHVS